MIAARFSERKRPISLTHHTSDSIDLEQPLDQALGVDPDAVGGGHARQAGHGHDVAADRDHELGAVGEPDLTHRHHVVRGRVRVATPVSISSIPPSSSRSPLIVQRIPIGLLRYGKPRKRR